MEYTNCVNLLVRGVASSVFIVSFVLLLRIMWIVWSSRQCDRTSLNISSQVIVYFGCWMLAIITLVPYSLTIFISWKPAGDYLTDGPLLFWSSIWMVSVTSSVPLSVFFLTLDRILFISFPIKYNERHKLIVVWATVAVIALVMFGNFIALLVELPILEYSKCRVFQCIFKKTGMLTYTYTRICCGFLNFLAGTYFLLKIWHLEKMHLKLTTSNVVFMQEKVIEKNSTINKLAILIIVTEFFLNFLPQLTGLLINKIFGFWMSQYIGPYGTLLLAIDLLIFTLGYSKILENRIVKNLNTVRIISKSISTHF